MVADPAMSESIISSDLFESDDTVMLNKDSLTGYDTGSVHLNIIGL
jgi:hypothetical protein